MVERQAPTPHGEMEEDCLDTKYENVENKKSRAILVQRE